MPTAQTTTNAYVAGGTNDITFFTPTATTEAFSPASGWASLGNMPVGRLAPGMSSILGRLIVYGGGDPSFTVLNSTVLCTLPSCTSWTAFARNLNTARWFLGYGTTSNNVYAAGGGDSAGNSLASAEKIH